MTNYQKMFLLYVKAIKERNSARTEGDWAFANKKCVIYKKMLDKYKR